jgi:hypothetical protein
LQLQDDIRMQHTFSQLGSHLAHLSCGTGNIRMPLQLSAPLNRMPALQSLISELGVTLDAEDIVYPDLDVDQPGAAQGADLSGSNGSSDSIAAAAAAAPLVPALTHLVLDGYHHELLFQLLTQPS